MVSTVPTSRTMDRHCAAPVSRTPARSSGRPFRVGRQLAVVVIGDAQQVRKRLERYGPVQQIQLAAGSFGGSE